MYLTYEEYTEMGGTLESTAFQNFEAESEAWINWYTFNRLNNLKEIPDELKKCVFKLIDLAKVHAELLAGISNTGGAGIASQSNDGVSISYNTISASEAFASLNSTNKGNLVEQTIRLYLNGIKDAKGRNALYRGVYEDE